MADGILNPIEQLEADFDFEVYTKQEVDALLDEKADKSDTYTKTETDALLDNKADADAVYTKTETDTLLSAKADKSTTLAGYGITDAYTKTQTDNLLNGKADADSVYTKQEIDTKIPSSVGSATKPTYVNGGVITECTHELNKTVPANAVFTDTTYSAGNGLNLSGTSFSAKAGTNVSVDGNGINVNGNGVVASADSGLINGGTAYTELRPTLDGTWVKNAQTTATNLQKLEGGIEYLYGLLSHQYDQLKKYINGNYYDYQTDSDSKYTKTVPQGAMPYASLEQIGGKTLVWNQLCGSIESNSYVTKVADGSYIADGQPSGYSYAPFIDINGNRLYTVLGHKYYAYITCNFYNIILFVGSTPVYPRTGYTERKEIVTATNNSFCSIRIGDSQGSTVYDNVQIKCKICDLTLMFGSGNEPSTPEEFEAWFPAEIYSYSDPTLLSAGVTEVVSKKADNTTIATYSIPASIQALEGYGWSAGSVYNYIDYERKVFVQCVKKMVLDGTQTLSVVNWRPTANGVGWSYKNNSDIKKSASATSMPNMVADKLEVRTINQIISYNYGIGINNAGTDDILIWQSDTSLTTSTAINNYLSNNPITIYVELNTPIETDISAYLTDDGLIEVEAGGTLEFPNQNGDDYRIPVPSSETYMVDLQASLGG